MENEYTACASNGNESTTCATTIKVLFIPLVVAHVAITKVRLNILHVLVIEMEFTTLLSYCHICHN